MFLLESTLKNLPVTSIQTSAKVCNISKPIIDPHDLSIIAYEIKNPISNTKDKILITKDIREITSLGLIIDSIDKLSSPDDNPKIKKIYDLHFDVSNKSVLDEKGEKLGKIIDFTIETTTFAIQQLTVKRPILKSFNDTELLIHRTQIIEINDNSIVVHSRAKVPEPELHEVVGSYVNPFRKTAKSHHMHTDAS